MVFPDIALQPTQSRPAHVRETYEKHAIAAVCTDTVSSAVAFSWAR